MSFQWLRDEVFNVYSQWGEDGMLQAIFRSIGAANRWCLEVGAADGLFFSNTRRLVRQGWDAIWIEADPERFRRLVERGPAAPEFDAARVRCINERIECLDTVLAACGAPSDIDLAVVDVDGQDYYLVNSLVRFRPRVLLVEFDPNADPDFIPEHGGAGQAGRGAMTRWAVGRQYVPIGTTGTNLVLVKHPLDRLLDRP